MKISKLFHWLYAILMLLPFLAVAFNFVRFGLSSSVSLVTWADLSALIWIPTFGGLSSTVNGVYVYLIEDMFNIVNASLISSLLTYWTIISIVYLIFDVFMYVPLLVHRWIDKARLE